MAGEKKSRVQRIQSLGNLTALAGVVTPLSLTPYYVKSVIIQGLDSNTDFAYVGDALLQTQSIEPRRSLVIWGDALDNGTDAQLDLSQIFFRVAVNGEGVSVTYLEGA